MAGSADNTHPRALAAQEVEVVAADVAHYIRLIKPQVVITFDPIGGYMHPDHIAIHKAATRAFHTAGDPSQYPNDLPAWKPHKLYYQIFPRDLLRIGLFFMRLVGKDPHRMGKNQDIDLVPIAETKFPVHATVDYRSVMKQRDEASLCHASQGGAKLTGGIMDLARRIFGVRDQYMRAYPQPTRRKEIDLFEGIWDPKAQRPGATSHMHAL